jgi:hypothetical protein
VLLEISALPGGARQVKPLRLFPRLTVTVPIVLLGRKAPQYFEPIQLHYVCGQDPVATVFLPGLCPSRQSRYQTGFRLQLPLPKENNVCLTVTMQPLVAPMASAVL